MDITIPHSWLKDFLKAKVNPNDLAHYLSLSGPSVEKIEKVKDDHIYQIEVTSNRPDALSVFGIAQEAFAILPQFNIATRLVSPKWVDKPFIPSTTKFKPLKVNITKPSLVPRFSAVVLDQVKVDNSPQWMAKRLLKVGLRPINNIVDVSNYIMIEMGQPLHTFDYDKIQGFQMIVRESSNNEEITTLDGEKRKLPKGTIVIADQKRLIDLCGIMGGKNSQIDSNTKTIVIFVQTYDPARIRKTTQAIGFRTEASSRFEKKLNPEAVIPALSRATELVRQLSGGKVASELIDIYPNKIRPKSVSLRLAKLESILGVEIPFKTIKSMLKRLGFEVISQKDKIICQVPSYRADDIEIEEDLIEEIARVFGYHNLPSNLPSNPPPIVKEDQVFKLLNEIKKQLMMLGFTETYSYSMVSENLLNNFGYDIDQIIQIRNPLNVELSYLRPSLIPSLAKIYNQNEPNIDLIKIFELANVYSPQSKGLPNNQLTLTLLDGDSDFYSLKGIIDLIFSEFLKSPFGYKIGNDFRFEPSKQSNCLLKGINVGVFGYLRPKIYHRLSIKTTPIVAEFNLTQISKYVTFEKQYQPISKFVQKTEDLTLIIPKELSYEKIQNLIATTVQPQVNDIELIDIYQSPKLGKSNKSVTLRLYFREKSSKDLEKINFSKFKEQIINKLYTKFNFKVKTS